MASFMREKKIYCGDKYLEVDIYPYTVEQREAHKRGGRSKKEKETAPKQKNLNDKKARRYFTQLINANFGSRDFHVTLTYKDAFLPNTIEEAEKEVRNFLRRVSYRMQKEGLKDFKYILVTEYIEDVEDNTPVRIHHHLILSGGLDRDTVEGLWSRKKKKGQKEGERIGYVNSKRLQPDDMGMAGLAMYLTKYPKRKKRWSASQNLVKPVSRTNDFKYSKREAERIAKEVPDVAYWEKKYKGYTLANSDYALQTSFHQDTGWYIAVKLIKKE